MGMNRLLAKCDMSHSCLRHTSVTGLHKVYHLRVLKIIKIYVIIWLGFKRQNLMIVLFYPPLNPLPRGDFFIPLLGGVRGGFIPICIKLKTATRTNGVCPCHPENRLHKRKFLYNQAKNRVP